MRVRSAGKLSATRAGTSGWSRWRCSGGSRPGPELLAAAKRTSAARRPAIRPSATHRTPPIHRSVQTQCLTKIHAVPDRNRRHTSRQKPAPHAVLGERTDPRLWECVQVHRQVGRPLGRQVCGPRMPLAGASDRRRPSDSVVGRPFDRNQQKVHRSTTETSRQVACVARDPEGPTPRRHSNGQQSTPCRPPKASTDAANPASPPPEASRRPLHQAPAPVPPPARPPPSPRPAAPSPTPTSTGFTAPRASSRVEGPSADAVACVRKIRCAAG